MMKYSGSRGNEYSGSRGNVMECESEDSDSSIDLDEFDDFSMANESAYAPGVSLEDKLRLAASKGQVERIPELLAKGATYEPDREGRTAIHYAALSGYAEAVRMLCANGCDINTRDNLGYTALHRAAAQGHIEVIRVLCEDGCDLDIQDEVHGNSALHESAWNGYSKTLEILTKYKANVTLINKAGFSALHLAAQNGHNQSARALLYAGCSPDCKNNYGDTPLHTAARYGHAGVTRILISAKCRPNEQNKNGDTALHIASALKRKKIAKLLVESNISIGMKNKQNETATDVSRRKEHPEIMMIITSQPKLQKKKKKEEKERKKLADKAAKSAAIEESEDQYAKKDKKGGFFFKKRSKSKDKENKENRDASRDRSRDRAMPSSSLDVQTGAMNGGGSQSDLLNGEAYGDQRLAKQKADKIKQSQGTSTRAPQGTSARAPHQHVHGLLTNYESKPGVQYYRDLAGNIKQGPVGYAPVCHCGPSFRKMAQRLDADRNNMYDHIDATHKMLTNRIEDVDHKCGNQVQHHDAYCRQRNAQDAHRRQEWLDSRILHERQDMEKAMYMQEHCMRAEYQDYVGRRFRNFEDHYAPLPTQCRGCEHCGVRTAHDDTALHRSSALTYDSHHGANMYRTRSDETLSVSSSHPSKRHWKMKSSKSKSIRELKDRYSKSEGRRGERPVPSRVPEVRPPPQGQVNDRPMVIYEEKTPSGRSPEGQSSGNDYTENSSYLDPIHLNGARSQQRPIPINALTHVNRRDANKELEEDFEHLTVRDFPQMNTNSGQNTSTPIAQPTPRPAAQPTRPAPQLPPKPAQQSYYAAAATQQTPTSQSQINSVETTPQYNAPYNNNNNNTPAENTPNFNTPNSSYRTSCSTSMLTTSGSSYVLSPDQVQVHHSKTDSGSNPDSGYSSKAYGVRPAVSGKSIGSSQGVVVPMHLPPQGQPLDLRQGNMGQQSLDLRQGNMGQQSLDLRQGNMGQQSLDLRQGNMGQQSLDLRQNNMGQQNRTNTAPNAGFSRPTAPLPRQHPMPMVPPQHSRYPYNPQPVPVRQTQVDNGTGPAAKSVLHKTRGYSSDGCPGMKRPKPDAYASDNCSGMRYPKPGHQYHRSVLSDWFEKHQSSTNGPIREVPSQSQDLNYYGTNTPTAQATSKPVDFWPGKATQV